MRDRVRRLFRVEFEFVLVNLVAGFDPLADLPSRTWPFDASVYTIDVGGIPV